MGIIPKSALPNVPMKRIHFHWTAGSYTPNYDYDRKAYHFIISGEPRLVLGLPTIDKNSGSLKTGYSAHTLSANSDAISVSVASMGGATEVPFNPGRFPMTEAQFDLMCRVGAELSEAYNIPITNRTVLTHAEVQPNLGIPQRAKWDFTRLAFKPELVGHKACGDYMRELISSYVGKTNGSVNKLPPPASAYDSNPIPMGATVKVAVLEANFRSAPNGSVSSVLPRGVQLTTLDIEGNWLHLKTPMGFTGWVSKELVEVVDGPPAESPTQPDKLRLLIASIRTVLNEYEGG